MSQNKTRDNIFVYIYIKFFFFLIDWILDFAWKIVVPPPRPKNPKGTDKLIVHTSVVCNNLCAKEEMGCSNVVKLFLLICTSWFDSFKFRLRQAGRCVVMGLYKYLNTSIHFLYYQLWYIRIELCRHRISSTSLWVRHKERLVALNLSW